jgi:hypothetical protein
MEAGRSFTPTKGGRFPLASLEAAFVGVWRMGMNCAQMGKED